MSRVKQRAQAILEFALCLAMVATAIGSMAIYIRRSLQARYRAGVLYYAKEVGTEPQYEPYYTREAETKETKEGFITEGFPKSSIDMETKTSGWRFTPLPGRSKSGGSTQPPGTVPGGTVPGGPNTADWIAELESVLADLKRDLEQPGVLPLDTRNDIAREIEGINANITDTELNQAVSGLVNKLREYDLRDWLGRKRGFEEEDALSMIDTIDGLIATLKSQLK